MLKLRKRAPSLTLNVLPGITVTVPPLTIAVLRAAENAGHRAMADFMRAAGVENMSDLDKGQMSDMEGAFAQARLAFLASKITAWDGIGDDDGAPVEPTPEFVALFVGEPGAATAFLAAYDASAKPEIAEKNASPVSGTGEPAAAPNTAEAAKAPAESVPA